MVEDITVLDEPDLEFRYGQRVKDPRDGLALFGPYGVDDRSTRPHSFTYIVVGTEQGIEGFHAWSDRFNKPSIEKATDEDPQRSRRWPPFPGFEAVYGGIWPERPVWASTIDRGKLLDASRLRDPHERTFAVVDHYLSGIRRTQRLDESVAVAICIIPDEVQRNCRPKSRVVNPVGAVLSRKEKDTRRRGQRDLFNSYDPEQYRLSPDFRRQLKARSMQYGIPLQLIRESTLRLTSDNPWGMRGLTPLSDRMWNLSTTLYYKCGGKPWRLATARDGVCYIGLAFRRTEDSTNTACCAAQMFLKDGDGVVFLGEYGPWYSTQTEQFHLSKSAARNLLTGVLQTYEDLGGKPLTEVFLHSRSSISDSEFEGYREACPTGVNLVGVRVRADDYGARIFRPGSMPVLRGTFWRIDDKVGYLCGAGFKPRIATYDGWEVPVPLRIEIQHGEASIHQVARDILGLTKLNYNACRPGDAQPVTVGFSDAVGEILISNPTITDRRPNFKFYI